MLLECGKCGAPLDVKRWRKVTKCRYCASLNDRTRMTTLAEETPKDFEQPKEWTPRGRDHGESARPLKLQPEPTPWFAYVFVAALLAIGLGLGWSQQTNAFDTKPEVLLHASPIGSHAEVAKRLGGSATGTDLKVPLRSDRYDNITLRYTTEADPIPNGITLGLRRGQPADPAARSALSAHLNGGLDDRGIWEWGPVRIEANSRMLNAHLMTDDVKDPLRERRMAALWKLVLGAAFDTKVAPSDQDMRELLGAGYPLSDLSKIPAETPQARAAAVVRSNFPGALVEATPEVNANVALDHPLLRSIRLTWNGASGRRTDSLGEAHIKVNAGYSAARPAFVRCVATALGKDPGGDLNAEYFAFYFGEPYLQLGRDDVTIMRLSLGDGATWTRFVRALDGCGR